MSYPPFPLCSSSPPWHGCYSGSFDLATPESNAHPAKIAFGLAFKINQHLEELELLKPGDCVLDMMCGTARIPIVACAMGYRAIGVELEKRFCAMARENAAYASRKLGWELDLTVIQGDARQLSELLQERGLVGEVSPPYADLLQEQKSLADREDKTAQYFRHSRPNSYDKTGIGSVGHGYSANPANIGNLKAITSPPYEEGVVNRDKWTGRRIFEEKAIGDT